jgi:hypothetical protein
MQQATIAILIFCPPGPAALNLEWHFQALGCFVKVVHSEPEVRAALRGEHRFHIVILRPHYVWKKLVVVGHLRQVAPWVKVVAWEAPGWPLGRLQEVFGGVKAAEGVKEVKGVDGYITYPYEATLIPLLSKLAPDQALKRHSWSSDQENPYKVELAGTIRIPAISLPKEEHPFSTKKK